MLFTRRANSRFDIKHKHKNKQINIVKAISTNCITSVFFKLETFFFNVHCLLSVSAGLLATVPSNPNGNGNNEASSDVMGFSVEASHDTATPSGK